METEALQLSLSVRRFAAFAAGTVLVLLAALAYTAIAFGAGLLPLGYLVPAYLLGVLVFAVPLAVFQAATIARFTLILLVVAIIAIATDSAPQFAFWFVAVPSAAGLVLATVMLLEADETHARSRER